MKVLELYPGADTAGLGHAVKVALERDGQDEVRLVTASDNYIRYPRDLKWTWPLVTDLYDWADVVLIANNASCYWKIEQGQRKPVLIYHHGQRLRDDPIETWGEGAAIGAVQVVSTIDLLLHIPAGQQGSWLPGVVDTERMARIRRDEFRPHKPLRVAHAPTNRQVKGTDHFLPAVRRLHERMPLDVVLTEYERWDNALAAKAATDFYYDQVGLGYGMSAVEAWSMGMPVMAGASPEILARMRQEFESDDLPFFETRLETIESNLEALAASSELRAEYAQRGADHVRRFHSEAAVVERLRTLFASLPPSSGVTVIDATGPGPSRVVRPAVRKGART